MYDEESPLELHQANSNDIDDDICIEESAKESLPDAIKACKRKGNEALSDDESATPAKYVPHLSRKVHERSLEAHK